MGKRDGRVNYCLPGGLEKILSAKDCAKYFNMVDDLRWTSLKEYANNIYFLNYVQLESKDWIKRCEWWAKNI